MTPPASPTRIEGLDGVRGVAALVVMLAHATFVLPGALEATGGSQHTWLLGEGMVRLFFVLSGFVLALPYWRNAALPPVVFGLRRLVRLYPPYLAALVLSAALALVIPRNEVPHASAWFQPYWNSDGLALGLARSGLVISGPFSQINTVIWSLIIEIRISLIFPLVLLAMRLLGWLSVPLAAMVSLSAAAFIEPLRAHVLLVEIPWSLSFLWFFVLGAELARRLPQIRALTERAPFSLAAALLALAWFLLVFHLKPPVPAEISVLYRGLAAGLIIVLVASLPRLQALFRSRPVKALGRMSYSLYLLHFPIIAGLVHLLAGVLSLPLILILACALSPGVSWVFCLLVEEPATRASRRIGRPPSAAA